VKILVTGSTGFIGANLCRGLLRQGHEVVAFHRPNSNLRLLEHLPVSHCTGDLTQPNTIHEAMRDVNVVFHAAAWMGGANQAGREYAVTVEGTRILLAEARRAGVLRVVHTSSVAALGVPDSGPTRDTLDPADVPLVNENHTWNYRPEHWSYAYAKYLAEIEVQKAVAAGQDIVIVNPTYVIGPGDIYRQSNSLIVRLNQKSLRFSVEGGVNAVHIDDIVDGHISAMQRGKKGERYILGGENLTHTRFLTLIAEVVGSTPPTTVLPGWLVRAAVNPLQLLQSFFDLPVSAQLFRQAGKFFYYDIRKSQVELGLGEPRPLLEAVQSAFAWFKDPVPLEL
jgi:dihydroflavonol-4-reductase